jgi:hypothetical protein
VNTRARAVLNLLVPAVSGIAVGSAATVVLTHGAHEAITVSVGDSIIPRFTVRTDSVLAVVGTKIVAKRCGDSFIYLRSWRGPVQLSADTIAVAVSCSAVPVPPTDTPKVASIEVCMIPIDSAQKYHIPGDRGLDSAQAALIKPWCQKSDTIILAPNPQLQSKRS